MDRGLHYDGPIVLVVMDGVGLTRETIGNAVRQARTEFLDRAIVNYLNIPLLASGEAVGIEPNTMGNSEVGHNALGAGQIVKQGIAHYNEAFTSGKIWESKDWQACIDNVLKNNSTLHFSGIFSDGKVHSDINHLAEMIKKAHSMGVKKIRIHCVFDGRDVAPQSEPKYIQLFENFFKQFPGCDYKIASGGGRMIAVADRYENDWEVVKRGWDMMVHGISDRHFTDATTAIQTLRSEDSSVQDQYLPPFVIVDENDQPVGKVKEGDSFIYYDFRADRAIEIAMAFTYNDFPYFNRSNPADTICAGNTCPKIFFAGLTEYNTDTHVPEHQLIEPVHVHNSLHAFLGERNISQLAISETVKFGHITYFFNGNSYQKARGEDHIEIPSYTIPFNTCPWMKSVEITDELLKHLKDYKFIRVNFPNPDMVGHFAELESTIVAIEAVDIQLARIAKAVDELGGMMIITADHGNAEELMDADGNPKTAHTTNPVPCIFYDNTENRPKYVSSNQPDAGLSNMAATITDLLGLDHPTIWRNSLIALRDTNV